MSGVSFDGIFNFYHKYYPGASIQNHVKIKTSSDFPGRGNPYYVIDPKITSTELTMNWLSESYENSSFMIIFQRDILMLSSYSLRARLDNYYNLPKEFVLEGSNDLSNWVFLHHKQRGDELTTKGNERNWKVNSNNYFRAFKLTMLGENYHLYDNEKYIFSLNKLEVFGTIHPLFKGCSCKTGNKYKQRLIFIMLFATIS